MNYTDILKWLREILICRNAFLSRHKDYANVGSHIAICRQAHIKLEVRTHVSRAGTDCQCAFLTRIYNLVGCLLHVPVEHGY
jgi:hypothetical protein